MNESAAAAVPYIPPGHPVRRFVLGIALVAALLGAVWWSGIGRPRLSIDVTEVSPAGAVIILTNDGWGSVHLLAASFDDPRLDGETVELPGGPLAGGDAIEVRVQFAAVCTPAPPGGYYLPLRITTHTAPGLNRTVTAGNIAMIGDLACDARTDVPTTDVPMSNG